MKVAHSTTSSTGTTHVTPLPRRIPGASMRPAATLRPLPGPTARRPLAVADFDRGAYDASFDRFAHHADKAFGQGDDWDGKPLLPRIPGPRKPSGGSAA